jgi:hypothetical protein
MFNGNKEDFKDWKQKVFIYINNAGNNVVQANKKIEIVLSYMEGKEIKGWVKNLWNQYYDEVIDRWDD